MSLLPERRRQVVVGNFLEERTLSELAEVGVTESRISQIRAEALFLRGEAIGAMLGEQRQMRWSPTRSHVLQIRTRRLNRQLDPDSTAGNPQPQNLPQNVTLSLLVWGEGVVVSALSGHQRRETLRAASFRELGLIRPCGILVDVPFLVGATSTSKPRKMKLM